jgi:hypothetical protein
MRVEGGVEASIPCEAQAVRRRKKVRIERA